ncbi:MFS transporter [Clostridium thailandense]|uniref:MFS transporter n=1 Tax=Clostridium thailandense TaxID=2794346 RepID=UPI003988DC46
MDKFVNVSKAKKLMFVIGVYLGIFATISIATADATFLPAAAKEIGGMDYWPIATTVSGLISAVFMPILGAIAIRSFSNKKMQLIVAMIVGAVALATNIFASSMLILIISRAFVGYATGCVLSVGFMGIGEMYSDEKERGKYLALSGTIMAICMLFASVVAGLIIDHAGWRYVQLYHIPFFILGIIFVAAGPNLQNEEKSSFKVAPDFLGILGFSLFLGGFLFALSLGNSLVPWGTPLNLVFFAALVVGLVILIAAIAKKKERALIPLNVLKNRNFDLLFGSYAANVMSSMVIFIFLPTFIMFVQHQAATLAGIVMLVLNIPGIILGAVLGKVIVKTGTVKGSVLLISLGRVIALLLLALVVTASSPIWLMCVISFLAGMTSALGNSAFTTAGQIQLPRSLQAQAIPTLGVASGIGSILGTVICTTFISQGIVAGFVPCLWISIVVLAISMLLVLPLKNAKQIEETERAKSNLSN